MPEQIDKGATQEENTASVTSTPEDNRGSQKDTQEMQHLASKEARAKMESVFEHQRHKAFVNMIDHEFRTALTGIQGFSELLCQEELSFEEVKAFARDIHSDAVRLSRAITRFIDLENMQSHRHTFDWTPVDLNAILRTVAEQAQLSTSRHAFHLDLDSDLPLIQGDQERLTQVASDLVSNAIRYSPRGGEILMKSWSTANGVQIAVRDHGIGIPAHSLETIFDTFSHTYVDKTRYVPGVGLGLPIIKQIVYLHGGRIWVESTPGEGSCFYITLPLPE